MSPDPALKSTRYARTINEQHLSTLTQESAIAQDVIDTRCYESVTTKARLKSLGFPERQCLVPGLLIPLWDVHGELRGYQLRPDSPRMIRGKVTKYETPAGMRMAIDVHPLVRHMLSDPGVPLFISRKESKKATALPPGVVARWAF